jgi:hypothetical protein
MTVIKPVDPSDKKAVAAFLELPFRLYRNTPQWVPPLDFEVRGIFDTRKNPFYAENEAAFYLATGAGGQPLGRLAILNNRRYNRYNHQESAFFFLFECENDKGIARDLFAAGCDWVKSRGLKKIIGPKGFTVFDGLGMLVKGFEHRPAFGIPYNLDYYQDLVEAAGFTTTGDLVSGRLDSTFQFPEKVHRAVQLVMKRRGLSIAHYQTRAELRKLAPKLKDMYNAALWGTTGNVPISDDEAKALANQLIWFANPRLIKIIQKDGLPVGFLFAYPDVSAAVQKIRGKVFPFGWIRLWRELHKTKWINVNGAGMIEGYRGLGGTAILFSEMYKSVVEEGYLFADLVQVGMENDNMQREMRDYGIEIFKTHRLYERIIA